MKTALVATTSSDAFYVVVLFFFMGGRVIFFLFFGQISATSAELDVPRRSLLDVGLIN